MVFSVLQNLLFCVPKAAVLHGKSVGFAAQNSRFRNVKTQSSIFKGIIFTKRNKKAHCFIRELAKRISTGLLA
ncbi:hypothetical protein CLI70_04765 [Prevotella intermedia]|nr:hypothetical protein CLI70_04765 [Prevotella intermedia]